MKKFLILVLLSLASLSSNAQSNQETSTAETWKSHYSKEFNFYVQDAWGVGLMIRKEISPYFGLNLIGASFMSGWGQYETPDNVGIVNARLLGLRVQGQVSKKLGVFAEVNPGYTYMYIDLPVHTMWYDGSIEGNGHCFGLDASAGYLFNKHIALAYNYSFFANGNGKGGIHWGRISVIF